MQGQSRVKLVYDGVCTGYLATTAVISLQRHRHRSFGSARFNHPLNEENR